MTMNLLSEDARRDPYRLHAMLRAAGKSVLRDPTSGAYMVFDYEDVRRVLSEHAVFSSRFGPDWMIFADPPRHAKLRALVSRAFTPRSVAELESRISELCCALLDRTPSDDEFDLVGALSGPLPMRVIAEMLGLDWANDGPRLAAWVDVILRMSYTVGSPGGGAAANAMRDFVAATEEMNAYTGERLAERRADPSRDNLLTRLAAAVVDGERLTQAEITGFFQLLLLGGSETTSNLISSAILCFAEHPEQLATVRQRPAERLGPAVEVVLRYRSPIQWLYRVARQDVEIGSETIPAGKLVFAMIGSANRDPRQFRDAEQFDVTREPNPHIAFGVGNHFCLGATLARLEARIALTELLRRFTRFELAEGPNWTPRDGLHIHGPARLVIRGTRAR
jgi:cytochrome P450